jgi:hypothetical protein
VLGLCGPRWKLDQAGNAQIFWPSYSYRLSGKLFDKPSTAEKYLRGIIANQSLMPEVRRAASGRHHITLSVSRLQASWSVSK